MRGKYGIIGTVSGVYKITNKITKDFYIGSSISVVSRFSNHLNRDARKQYGKDKFHTDVIDYGKENFKCELLEECHCDNLLEREQYYYDKLNPTYNQIRPCENPFKTDYVKKKARAAQQTDEHKEKRRKIHNSYEFKHKCKMINRNGLHTKDKPVEMFWTDTLIISFSSISTAARWISKTTKFKGKNKTSKIKAVCDGERITAYGYKWRYRKV